MEELFDELDTEPLTKYENEMLNNRQQLINNEGILVLDKLEKAVKNFTERKIMRFYFAVLDKIDNTIFWEPVNALRYKCVGKRTYIIIDSMGGLDLLKNAYRF